MRFERLVAIEFFDKKDGHHRWTFQCDCGNRTVVKVAAARSGKVKSCGCLHREGLIKRSTKHGMGSHGKRPPEYSVWIGMKDRCRNKNSTNYKNYGGRGITVCDRWMNSFVNFLSDMGHRPSSKHEIDRINTNGNYEPCNCRWASRSQNQRNKRNNRMLVYDGISLPVSQWADKLGIPARILRGRIRIGWPDYLVISTPQRTRRAPRIIRTSK